MKLAILIFLALCILLVGCDDTGEESHNAGPELLVVIQQNTFSPNTLIIKAGTTVKWINYDSIPHTVSSEEFQSGTLVKMKSYEHLFENAGTYEYNCGIHPSERGKIMVEE